MAVTLVLRKGVTLGRYQLVERQFDPKKKNESGKLGIRTEKFWFTESFQVLLAYCMLHGNKSCLLHAGIECDKCSQDSKAPEHIGLAELCWNN